MALLQRRIASLRALTQQPASSLRRAWRSVRLDAVINAEVVLAAEAALGEGCVWSPTEQLLVWVDIPKGQVHRFDHVRSQPVSVHQYDDDVGNAAPRASGGLALALGATVALTEADGAISRVIELPGEVESNRANDGAVDPAGRLFQGTMNRSLAAPASGALYRIDGDGSVRRLFGGVGVSNGIGWSPDSSTMYYIDTMTFRVDRFDYDIDTGEIAGRRPLVTFDDSTGAPDGMCVDSEGCLWVAFFGGFGVQRFSPDGEWLETVMTPGSPQTTCCCFAGPDLDTLYITTAAQPLAGVSVDGQPNAGALFAADVDATGMPTNLFAA